MAMTKIVLNVNGEPREIDVEPQMPLLWAIRDFVGLTGTKFGCGIGQCGACVIHLDGSPVRSCVIPSQAAAGKEILTIEGLSKDNDHAVQLAWIAEQVPQCGYCQSGQIMSAAALLKKNPNPSDSDIDAAMSSVLCRCGTYPRIKKAIKHASSKKR
jgi:isoquinoline 1-oxidoreductase alpha subunit